jgi:hypothetical protein
VRDEKSPVLMLVMLTLFLRGLRITAIPGDIYKSYGMIAKIPVEIPVL